MRTLNTDKSWKKYGKENPYYGVLSDDKYLNQNLSESVKEEFYESGNNYINRLFEVLEIEFKNDFRPKRALDFGCGTGRLTIPLARKSDHITGTDISNEMLEEAERKANELELNNISFLDSTEFLESIKENEYDFINSFIVFQHINVERGEYIFKKLYKSLTIGGIGAIHLTYCNSKPRTDKVISFFRSRIPFLHNFLNLVRGKRIDFPLMQMNSYNLNRIFYFLQKNGVGKTTIKYTDHGGHQGVLIMFQKEKITDNI